MWYKCGVETRAELQWHHFCLLGESTKMLARVTLDSSRVVVTLGELFNVSYGFKRLYSEGGYTETFLR